MKELMNVNVVNNDGIQVISTRDIANDFGKDHNDLKKKVRDLIKDMGEISHIYFIENEYVDSMNRTQEEYLLTRDGFSLLAMGFNGKKALNWKLKYIDAFNKMERALKEINLDSFMITDPIKRAEKWLKEEQKRLLLLEDVKEKEIIIDTMIDDSDLISVFVCGKVLKSYNKMFGAHKIFEYLRNKKMLMDRKGSERHNLPYDIHSKKFEIKMIEGNLVTYFNKKGLNSFLNMIIRDGLLNKSDKKSVMKDIEKELNR